jgi:hypothetical protein
MENRGGYAYGIWLLLTPNEYVPFCMQHRFHITLISGISCKRRAQKLFSRILKEDLQLPGVVFAKGLETKRYVGDISSAIGWKADIPEWESVRSALSTMCPETGDVPLEPHISLRYYRAPDFTFSDHYFKELSFSASLVLVDMNDPDPGNWRVIH